MRATTVAVVVTVMAVLMIALLTRVMAGYASVLSMIFRHHRMAGWSRESLYF